ncbi:MAG: hypothetical protein AUJ57_07910 [Zetaproteobacteria bacterium CG1_02_53_45]|nr:MAG: hypothetical protein AUJ57_07910 [Zetaproteobacteria bacterium CG1_02_53_45]
MQVSSATASTTTTSQQAKNDLGNKDIFLKLLVAQLENQDPLKPQDATQMSSQLAQFNMVEQQTSTNTKLDSLIAMGGNNASTGSDGAAANYLGHPISFTQDGVTQTGIVEAIRFNGAGTELVVNGAAVSLTQVTEIRL